MKLSSSINLLFLQLKLFMSLIQQSKIKHKIMFKSKKYISINIFIISLFFSPINANNYSIEKIDLKNNIEDIKLNSITQDEFGYIWLSSNKGIIRFDGLHSNIFSPDNTKNTYDHERNFSHILPYTKDRMLTATDDGQLFIFNNKTEEFSTVVLLNNVQIFDISKNIKNQIYILTNKGLYILESLYKIKFYPINLFKIQNKILNGAITTDSQKNVWMTINGALYKLNIIDNKIMRIYEKELLGHLTEICYSQSGNLIIGSKHAGLYTINLQKNKITNIKQPYYKAISIGSNHITKLFVDKFDNCWIGSQYSLKIASSNDFNLEHPQNAFKNEYLIDDRINYIFEDKDAVVWVITNESEIKKFTPDLNQFSHFSSKSKLTPYAIDNKVNTFYQDRIGKIWVGTRSGITIFDPISKNLIPLTKNKNELNNLNEVSGFFEISKDSLLVSTWNRLVAFSLYNFSNNSWRHFSNTTEQENILGGIAAYNNRIYMASFGEGLLFTNKNEINNSQLLIPEKLSTLHNNSFYDIMADSNQKLWFIDYKNGLVELHPNTQKFNIYKQSVDTTSLSDNLTNSIFQDQQGRIWVGTNNGLNLFDPQRKKFKRIYPEKWTRNNSIKAITQDKNGKIWLSQEDRILCFDPDQNKFIFINVKHLIPNVTFQGKSAFCDNTGTIYFGTLADGFITIDANNINAPKSINHTISALYINDIKVENGKVYFNTTLLAKSLNATKQINFSYKVNKITIILSLLSYSNNSELTFAYKFDNQSSDWTYSKNPTITLTNLPPGKYKLLTKVANDMGNWTNEQAPLILHIQTPPWKSWWAYMLYILVILVIIALLFNNILKKNRLTNELKMERFEKEQIKIMDNKKVQFFTNISHEFRTPITLISNYVHKIITNTQPNSQNYHELKMVHYTSEQLLILVNQFLDYRKFEENKIQFNPKSNDLITECFRNYQQFEAIAKSKNIEYIFESEIDNLTIWFDVFILDRILFNLLSNAFKFTNAGSWIKLSILISDQKIARIQVQDAGIGIAENEKQRIFEDFYQSQSEPKINSEGTGIGLAFSKKLAHLHFGAITVESELKKGSTFTFTFPIVERTDSQNNKFENHLPERENTSVINNAYTATNKYENSAMILVVEDNHQLRSMIANELSKKYIVKEAENGKQGFEMSTEHIPDLIISDVQMPIMNGYEMCRKIKMDISVSHIPVILLTAKVLKENKLEGYYSGADDYIEKPFTLDIITLKINNILETRWKLKSLFGSGKIPLHDSLNSKIDNDFFKSAFDIINNNYSDSSFDVEQFCIEMNMSQNTIYRKIKAITGLSLSEFIRIERLKKAAELIKENNFTIQEVCYKVGFSSPAYFTQCFKKQYGVVPKEYLRK